MGDLWGSKDLSRLRSTNSLNIVRTQSCLMLKEKKISVLYLINCLLNVLVMFVSLLSHWCVPIFPLLICEQSFDFGKTLTVLTF